ncbi:MAG TPA: RNA polymerase subunit sigma-70, partial [Alteromonas sp.]|nr:RNA polymerase subunit sigma-70 [Alteromonas sp.]
MSVDNTIHNAYMTARNGIAKMLSRLVPPKEVDDILQDTYVRLCQVKDTSHIREPRSFLYKTARNLAYDHLKRADVRLIDDAIEAIDQLDSQLDEFEDETLRQTASQQEF